VSVFALLFIAKKNILKAIAIWIMAVIICLPPVFFIQRTVPALVNEPYTYSLEKDFPQQVARGRNTSSYRYIRIGRFIELFADHVLSIDLSQNKELYNILVPYEADELPDEITRYYINLSNTDNPADTGQMTQEADSDNEAAEAFDILNAYSNGRVYIYQQYLAELNMTGHQEMSFEMANVSDPGHAHNTYIQFAYDRGLVAGALYIVVIGVAFVRGLIYFRRNSEGDFINAAFPVLIIVAVALLGLVELTFGFSNTPNFLLFLVMAPLLYFSMRNKKRIGIE
jgi:hypothetical protein